MTEGASQDTMHMKYKIVFLGDQSVGKTSIILRFTQDSFDGNYQVKYFQCYSMAGYNWNRFPIKDYVRG